MVVLNEYRNLKFRNNDKTLSKQSWLVEWNEMYNWNHLRSTHNWRKKLSDNFHKMLTHTHAKYTQICSRQSLKNSGKRTWSAKKENKSTQLWLLFLENRFSKHSNISVVCVIEINAVVTRSAYQLMRSAHKFCWLQIFMCAVSCVKDCLFVCVLPLAICCLVL